MTELQKRCQFLQELADGGVFKRGAAGETVQWSCVTESWNDYQPQHKPDFGSHADYRIKPEPQYRPFTPEEALKQVGRLAWVNGELRRIVGVGNILDVDCFLIAREKINGMPVSHADLGWFCSNCKFDDESRCGVRID